MAKMKHPAIVEFTDAEQEHMGEPLAIYAPNICGMRRGVERKGTDILMPGQTMVTVQEPYEEAKSIWAEGLGGQAETRRAAKPRRASR